MVRSCRVSIFSKEIYRAIWFAGYFFCAAVSPANADAKLIKAALSERLPELPAIDEISPSAVAGLWEIRVGPDIFYSDARGDFLINGEIIDLQKSLNLTRARVEALTRVDFAALPLRDAVVWKRGAGTRKLAVFADPGCGYCKHLERELSGVDDITVYTFLVPILGGDSPATARAIWCAPDSGAVWRQWMLDGTAPPPAAEQCDSTALQRNVAFGEKNGITGTPTLVFEDSRRVPGSMSAADLEKTLTALQLTH